MHSVLAIAQVTFKYALRKKVFFTVLFFGILLMLSSGFLPWVTPEEQISQVSNVCLAGISFFGMIIAVFLSAVTLPEDISAKTIWTVLTKPARRWQILGGKILGLGYTLALLVAVMGALSYGYIHFWTWKVGPNSSGLPRLEGNKINYASTIDYHGLILAVSKPMTDSKRAIASGFDRVTFSFEGLDKERFAGDKVFARVTLFSHSWTYDPVTKQGTAAIEVANPTTSETSVIVFGAETLRPTMLGFSKSLIDRDGKVAISVLRYMPSGSYSASASSVAVLSQPSGYGRNFLKALVLLYTQYMVLVFLATAASTFLTSTVSTITAFFIYFTGSFVEILRNQALSLGAGTNIFTMSEHTHEASGEQLAGIQWFINILLRYFYLGVSILFPNLDYYNRSADISRNEFLGSGAVAWGVVYAAIYAALAFTVGWFVFRRKEVE